MSVALLPGMNVDVMEATRIRVSGQASDGDSPHVSFKTEIKSTINISALA